MLISRTTLFKFVNQLLIVFIYLKGKKGVTPISSDAKKETQTSTPYSSRGAYAEEDTMPISANDIDYKPEDEVEDCNSFAVTVGGVLVAPVSSTNGNTDSTKKLGVGGWGVDAGETWRPISLPKTKDFIAQSTVNESFSVSVSEASTSTNPISLRKDELLTLVIRRLSPYFAIVNGNGEAKVSSGEPPNIIIDSERRAGNKVC